MRGMAGSGAIPGKGPKHLGTMKTESKAKEPAQRGHINLSEPGEIHYWAKTLGVSDEEIIDAVKQVGGAVDEVRKLLKRSK